MADEQTAVSSTAENSLDNFTESERSNWLMKGTAMPKDEAESAPAAKEPSEAAKPESIAPAADTGDQQEPKGRAGQRIQELLGERAALRARLAELEKPVVKPADSTPAKPAAGGAPADSEPQPPDPTKWTGNWEELEAAKIAYLRDLTKWELGKGERDRAAAANTGKLTELQAGYKARADVVLAAEPEYADAQDIIGRFATAKGVDQLLLESAVGPEIVLHLYRLPQAEQQRVANLSTAALAREIGKIEAQLSKAPGPIPLAEPVPAPAPTTRRTSAAAKPPVELSGARAGSNVDEAEQALADGDTGRYIEVMNAREVKGRK